MEPQLSDTVLMVRPSRFGPNLETAASNVFQARDLSASHEEIHLQAIREFDGLRQILVSKGVNVIEVLDPGSAETPDSIFPNNWFSTHASGTIVLFPMESRVRRRERRWDIITILKSKHRFRRVVDLTSAEQHGRFLEGTGSMVLDRAHGVVYACRSSRTHPDLVKEFSDSLGYERTELFTAVTLREAGYVPIYHTNVLMSVGEASAVVCLQAIPDRQERERLTSALRATNHIIVEISREQMHCFVGNLLQLRTTEARKVWVMSSRAFSSLTLDQKRELQADGSELVHAPLQVIETVGGGSARCMLAEIHSPIAG